MSIRHLTICRVGVARCSTTPPGFGPFGWNLSRGQWAGSDMARGSE
jgi:hypothetical protein